MRRLSTNIINEMTRNRYLLFGLFAQRNANSVAYPVGEKGTNSHRTLDASVLSFSSLCNAKVERIAHIFLLHFANKQAHSAHHDNCIARFDGDNYILKFVLFANTKEL